MFSTFRFTKLFLELHANGCNFCNIWSLADRILLLWYCLQIIYESINAFDTKHTTWTVVNKHNTVYSIRYSCFITYSKKKKRMKDPFENKLMKLQPVKKLLALFCGAWPIYIFQLHRRMSTLYWVRIDSHGFMSLYFFYQQGI